MVCGRMPGGVVGGREGRIVAQISESGIQTIVENVLASLRRSPGAPQSAQPLSIPTCPTARSPSAGEDGVFESTDQAVEASTGAFRELSLLSLVQRGKIISAIRKTCEEHAEDFARRALEETKIGRLDHKVEKHRVAARLTPGIEDLEQKAWTGDHGLTVVEMAPYGVIGAVLPATHPVPTIVSNAIAMVAAGNSVVFAPHPAAKSVSALAIQRFSRAIVAAGGPRNLLTTVRTPSIEEAQVLFNHPKVRLLVVTGGPGVVKAAMACPKKAIVAGPGNPPVVVDETADLKKAARDIFDGAVFDNNVLCIAEKEVFVVDPVADQLKRHFIECGSYELSTNQISQLADVAFLERREGEHAVLNRDLVGRDASVLARAIGLEIDPKIELLIGECEFDCPFVQEEQMMPFIPIVRCRDVDQAIDMAFRAEHGFGHTALIHSKNVETMSKMARIMDTTIFVKNGSSAAGNGLGGEGYNSFTIATPTGEGITHAQTFTRQRRCVLVDYFRIV